MGIRETEMIGRARRGRLGQGRRGSALILVVVGLVVLMTLGLGMLTVGWGARRRAIMLKSEAGAMLAAEAGYEKAIYWMSQQPDMLSALQQHASGTGGSLSFPDSRCDYQIKVFTFLGHRPVYQVFSTGYSGVFRRTVDVYVVQATSGWDMGKCRVASGSASTYPVYFADGEIIDIPVHINDLKDSPDERDIYIKGDPKFLQLVTMGERRYTSGGYDKYNSVMGSFDGGIYFDQPECRITDEGVVQSKVDRFEDSTDPEFRFKPAATAPINYPQAAVQLEFFVDGGVGKVRITDNCTVRGFRQSYDSRTWDFRIRLGTEGSRYDRYYIYGYHLRAEDGGAVVTYAVEDTYVSQSFGEYESEPGGQIFVNGNVIIGGDDSRDYNNQVVKGKMVVVATGNIWIADSIVLDGRHNADGTPAGDNPSVLGLIAQGVVKVVDPGMSDYSYVDNRPEVPEGFMYIPIGRPDFPDSVEGDENYHKRHLGDPTVVEAAITIGGGGWGAENVQRGSSYSSYGGRKESYGVQDYLYLRGTLVEAIRGVVGLVGEDGYLKRYYFDERLLEGILPADIWLRGKYVPAPAGWHDYRAGI